MTTEQLEQLEQLGSYTAAMTLVCLLNEKENGKNFDFSTVVSMVEAYFNCDLNYLHIEYMKDIFETALEQFADGENGVAP